MCPHLKRPSLNPIDFDNFHPVSMFFLFLEKLIEKIVGIQLLTEADYLEIFLLGFSLGYNTKIALITFTDSL